mmetsp:Transcript_20742/g.24939  ORF Transcript_20742/g.24939 Transcript_20742/m.24939 type:complete len:298 (+) Transcript_20742:4590-5483(+)
MRRPLQQDRDHIHVLPKILPKDENIRPDVEIIRKHVIQDRRRVCKRCLASRSRALSIDVHRHVVISPRSNDHHALNLHIRNGHICIPTRLPSVDDHRVHILCTLRTKPFSSEGRDTPRGGWRVQSQGRVNNRRAVAQTLLCRHSHVRSTSIDKNQHIVLYPCTNRHAKGYHCVYLLHRGSLRRPTPNKNLNRRPIPSEIIPSDLHTVSHVKPLCHAESRNLRIIISEQTCPSGTRVLPGHSHHHIHISISRELLVLVLATVSDRHRGIRSTDDGGVLSSHRSSCARRAPDGHAIQVG